MAGAGKKTFTAGETLTASDVNTYLMEQSVMVFGGTAARSSAIPTPSEGMVSYRSDIDNLELYNGSNWKSVAGQQFINNSTFTSQTTYNINSLFSAEFTKYKMLIQFSAASANLSVQMQMRTGATNTATGYFYGGQYVRSNGGTGVLNGNGATFIDIGRLESGSGNRGFIVIDISNPFATNVTNFIYQSTGSDGTSPLTLSGGGLLNNSTSYDGLALIASTGNFSGTIQTFGFRD